MIIKILLYVPAFFLAYAGTCHGGELNSTSPMSAINIRVYAPDIVKSRLGEIISPMRGECSIFADGFVVCGLDDADTAFPVDLIFVARVLNGGIWQISGVCFQDGKKTLCWRDGGSSEESLGMSYIKGTNNICEAVKTREEALYGLFCAEHTEIKTGSGE